MRKVLGLALVMAWTPSLALADATNGARIYADNCVSCHGIDGKGAGTVPPYSSDLTFSDAVDYISTSMPPGNPGSCQGQCAEDVAKYILGTLLGNATEANQASRTEYELRRKSRAQYVHSVEDLFDSPTVKISTDLGVEFPGDNVDSGFEQGGPVSELHAYAYVVAAENIARQVAPHLSDLASCKLYEKGNVLCAIRVIRAFVPKAYRRPLELEDLKGLIRAYMGASSHQNGLERIVEAILQSPFFLYQLYEPAMAKKRISGRVLADKMAGFLWAGAPDEQLLATADAGKLTTDAQILAEARRMLADSKARRGFRSFYRQWLKLPPASTLYRDPAIYPTFDRAMAADIDASFDGLVDYLVWDGPGTLRSLFETDLAFNTKRLAPLLGLSAPAKEFAMEHIDKTRRLGILTQPAFLATYASPAEDSPIHRGVAVLRQLMCHPMPPPPQNLPLTAPATATTHRKRIEAATSSPTCMTCHSLINPLGFGLGNFDSLGAYRDEDHGLPIDTSATFEVPTGTKFSFTNAPELSRALAASKEVGDCLVMQLFRYATGRLEKKSDDRELAALKASFAKNGSKVRDLLLDMVTSEAFLTRAEAK